MIRDFTSCTSSARSEEKKRDRQGGDIVLQAKVVEDITQEPGPQVVEENGVMVEAARRAKPECHCGLCIVRLPRERTPKRLLVGVVTLAGALSTMATSRRGTGRRLSLSPKVASRCEAGRR